RARRPTAWTAPRPTTSPAWTSATRAPPPWWHAGTTAARRRSRSQCCCSRPWRSSTSATAACCTPCCATTPRATRPDRAASDSQGGGPACAGDPPLPALHPPAGLDLVEVGPVREQAAGAAGERGAEAYRRVRLLQFHVQRSHGQAHRLVPHHVQRRGPPRLVA